LEQLHWKQYIAPKEMNISRAIQDNDRRSMERESLKQVDLFSNQNTKVSVKVGT
jgi:hypothetical protein